MPSPTLLLLALPSELLSAIAVHAGPQAALRLSATCRLLHSLIVKDSDALWVAFLAAHNYPEYQTVPASQARETAREWYCRQCDTIVSRNRMFYTGNICINCEYKYPSERPADIHCLGRVLRARYGHGHGQQKRPGV